jgi:hypothetical protein
LHFSLVLAVSSHDVLSDLARGSSWLSSSLEKYWQKAEGISARLTGTSASDPRLVAGVLSSYLYCTGIEAGYGFFAPNVPNSSKVVFELHYADGHVEYDVPHVSDAATGLRLISVLDYIGQTEYEPLRQVMVKMLAYSTWQQHPDALTIRAVYGFVSEPTLAEAKRGEKESYHSLYAYDFDFRPVRDQSTAP